MRYLLSEKKSESLQIWIKELREFQLDSMFDTNVLARAYLYTKSTSIPKNEEKSIIAYVGKGNKYEVNISIENNQIYGSCSCPYDGKCKHLAASILFLISASSESIKF